MADLLKEFFRRDLTDPEEERLAQQLAASPKVSMRFAKLAKKAYLATGLPNPEKPGGGSSGPGGSPHLGPVVLKSVVVAALLGGLGLLAWNVLKTPPETKPLPTPTPTPIVHVKPPAQPKPTSTHIPQPKVAPKPVPPTPLPPAPLKPAAIAPVIPKAPATSTPVPTATPDTGPGSLLKNGFRGQQLNE
jgi:hypothetical protein